MIKKIFAAIGIGILAIALGFAVRMYNEGGLPATIIAKSFAFLSSARTIQYSGTVVVGSTGAAISPNALTIPELTLTFNGTNDFTNPARPRADFSLSTKLPAIPGVTTENETGFIKFDLRLIGQSMFARLAAAPKIELDLSSLINKWVRIDPAELSTYSVQPVPPTLSPAHIQQIQQDLIASGVIRYTKTLPDAHVGEIAMHRYSVIIDKDRLISFIPKLTTWTQSTTGQTPTPAEQESTASLIDTLRQLPADAFPIGEILISRDGGLLQQISFTWPAGSNTLAISGPSLALNPFTIATTVSYSGYNEGVNIEEPKDFISLTEAISQVMTSAGRPAANVSLAEITSWIASLPAATRADIDAAHQLVTKLYASPPATKALYLSYVKCAGSILETAANKLKTADIAALRTKAAALKVLVPDTASQADADLIRDDLPFTLYTEYIIPNVVAEVGLGTIVNADRVLGAPFDQTIFLPSRASCKSLPVATTYK